MRKNVLFQPGQGIPGEINIRELLFKYLTYWYWFVIGLVLCVMAAFFYLRYYTTSQYYIASTILIKDNPNSNGISEGLPGGIEELGKDKNLGNEIVILKSRSLMERVLSELSLNTSYWVEGRFRDVEVFKEHLPITLIINELNTAAYGKSINIQMKDNNSFAILEKTNNGEEISTTHKYGQQIKKPYATFTVLGSSEEHLSKPIIVKFHDVSKLSESYSSKLWIELENNDAKVLRLGIVDPVPERGITILNKLVEVYNNEAMEDKNLVDLNTIEFLDKRIKFLSTELSEVEKNVEQYKQQNNLTDVSSNAQLYLQRASDYNKQLGEYEIQIDLLSSLEDYLQQEEPKLVPSSLNFADPTLNGLIAKFNELQMERQRLLRTIQPNSSLIRNIDDQLENLNVNIRENLKNIKSGLIITRDNLRTNSDQFQTRIQQVPSIERELLEINRQQSIKQAIYLFLLQKREEAGLSLASSIAKARVIDSASSDHVPISPKKSSIYLGALMAGLLLPFGLIFLKDQLNDKITGRKEIEHGSNIPILGEILHSDMKEALQVTDGNNSPNAEIFRLLRANLHFASIGKKNQVNLVTSSRSGEGKTFFSINLGASLALSGKKVVMLDFDLRRPMLMQDLHLANERGITDFLLSDRISMDSLITPVGKVSGLFAIGAGTIPPNPAELMTSPKIQQLIEELKNSFDYIIIDSPPVGQVADAYNLTHFSDSTFYIVRYNYSTKSSLTTIEDIYVNKKLKHPMIVMNDANKRKENQYGYSYHQEEIKV